MRRASAFLRIQAASTGVLALSMCIWAAAQVPTTMPPPNHNLTPTPQKRQPPAQPQKQSPGARAAAPIPAPAAGAVEGFVYWDANAIAHKPASSCTGMAITVSVGSSSNGPFQSYAPMATVSNNFKYAGQVKAFLSGGKIDLFDVCAYGYNHVPVGPDLQVKLTIVQPTAFTPVATPQFSVVSPVKIINAKCNMLPKAVPTALSDLTVHWGSCQNMAYGVNFVLLHPVMLHAPGTSGGSGASLGGSAPQQGMLSGGTQQGMLAPGGATGMLVGNGQPPQAQKGGIQNPGGKVMLNPQPLPPRQMLTNADVIKMVRGGIPESVITHTIQSAGRNFDLSPAGCHALQAAHVSRQVLDAMGDGRVRPCLATGTNRARSTGSLITQPLPPHSPQVTLAIAPMQSDPPKAGRKITNPQLAHHNSSIIAILLQQREAAEQESAAMKLGLHSAVGAPSQSGSVRQVNPAAAGPVSSKLQRNTDLGSMGSSQTMGANNSPNSMIAYAPQLDTTVLTCSHDPTPRILKVSGASSPGVLTPESKYNLYTIVGCSFGPSRSGNIVRIYGNNGFKENLNVDFWSDNGITVHFDPYLAGVLDQDNVTLVIAPAGRQPFQKSGFKFHAARGMPGPDGNPLEVLLPTMPQSSVNLSDASPILAAYGGITPNTGQRYNSFWSFKGTPVAGWVFRYAFGHGDSSSFRSAECFVNDVAYNNDQLCAAFGIGKYGLGLGPWKSTFDAWDFNKLVTGFQVSSYQLFTDSPNQTRMCGAWDDGGIPSKIAKLYGGWDYNLTPKNQIVVKWAINYCGDHEANPAGRRNMVVESSYGLAVWVLGPRCVDPWTAQPDQGCMASVRKFFGS